MTSKRIELLGEMPAFGGLKEESLDLILRHSEEINTPADDFFFHEGEPGDSLFVLESGTAIAQRMWQGEPIVLGRFGEGDCFGEMALIDFQRRSASVKAESDCRAIEVPSKSLRALYKQDVEQYAMIMMNLGREVSRRLRMTGENLFQLQQNMQRASG